MRTKKNEEHILNLANHFIGRLKLTPDRLVSHDGSDPTVFRTCHQGDVIRIFEREMTPETVGGISFFSLGKEDPELEQSARRITFDRIWTGNIAEQAQFSRWTCGEGILLISAMVAIIGAMYEILLTEKGLTTLLSNGKCGWDHSGIAFYEPSGKMLDFVKKTRLKLDFK